MSRPVVGVIVGGALGLIDGASAWAHPEARAMIAAIVVAELAAPGKELEVYSRSRLKRQR